MDFFDLLFQVGLVTSGIVFYLIVFKKSPQRRGNYSNQGWNYPLKYVSARFAVGRWKARRPAPTADEAPRSTNTGWDSFMIRATALDGTNILLGLRRISSKKQLAEVTVYVQLPDGLIYRLPRHPDTAVAEWEPTVGSWTAGGLKIQVLQPQLRLRILYNGLLTRNSDNSTQHVRVNLIWSSGSEVHHHPDHWSSQLAAAALAREPWRDGHWINMLDRWQNGSWLQWGAVQGRIESYRADGPDVSVWLRARGSAERAWAPHGYQGLRRQVDITLVAEEGTMVQLRAQSYEDVLTHVVSGCVRLPDSEIYSIVSTDFALPDFGEHFGGVPELYTLNVKTSNGRTLKLILRMNKDGGTLLSGVPYKHEVEYQTLTASIDGFQASGFLEMGYKARESREPTVPITPARHLKWKSTSDISSVELCHDFEDDASANPDLVGGKGASLALLASVQHDEGYKVPPGFCLTTLALDKQLESNPGLKDAISEIEAATVEYSEAVFKEKCNKASSLFASTELVPEVKESTVSHLQKLRQRALEEGLGPEVRFAVRSSAIGEDGETLSCAGQNDTILGCVSDSDVLSAVPKCWGSLFAFTSAHYRRQNGQPCYVGAGVVVQVLVPARAAGVMFTRHPDRGDPGRILLTANYGLGESVVSGSVEPDTIIVSRNDKTLTISKIELGSKTHRVAALSSGDGVAAEPVPEGDRKLPCLAETEVLRLANIAVAQEELWGAPRDIEWAVFENSIYLLQARPITSLERWSEEELLHEMDSAIMSEHTMGTFANTGEVMPKPMCTLNMDMVLKPLSSGVNSLFHHHNMFKEFTGLTHYRTFLNCYNSIYRRVANKIDVGVRMTELAVFGHAVADTHIHSMATHIHPPKWYDIINQICLLIKVILTAKWYHDSSAKRIKSLQFDTSSREPRDLLETLLGSQRELERFTLNHIMTSSGSSASQILAMTVLLEGGQDVTPEQCSEIGMLLSSGDTVSAEVPQAVDRLARAINDTEIAEDFRMVDPKEGLAWLKDNIPAVYGDVMKFLDEHGHRAIMEFDLATKPWVLAPEQLIEALQNMRPHKQVTHAPRDDAQMIAALTTPKKSSTRKVLSWVLPLSRRIVVYRESTKANLVLCIHRVRLLSLSLGRALVRRWMLPHPDLVFYFSMYELQDYVESRDPVLLRKAQLRQQHYPAWSQHKFSEVQTGWPRPLPRAAPRLARSGAALRATPVCAGDVLARAAVVNDLSEIGQLQQGDILITHSTDIGWSPYFPLLSGIVTELGGLISHGAVIAREYGLPCIVGAAGATDLFVTGDLLRLSGTTGLVEKVDQEVTDS